MRHKIWTCLAVLFLGIFTGNTNVLAESPPSQEINLNLILSEESPYLGTAWVKAVSTIDGPDGTWLGSYQCLVTSRHVSSGFLFLNESVWAPCSGRISNHDIIPVGYYSPFGLWEITVQVRRTDGSGLKVVEKSFETLPQPVDINLDFGLNPPGPILAGSGSVSTVNGIVSGTFGSSLSNYECRLVSTRPNGQVQISEGWARCDGLSYFNRTVVPWSVQTQALGTWTVTIDVRSRMAHQQYKDMMASVTKEVEVQPASAPISIDLGLSQDSFSVGDAFFAEAVVTGPAAPYGVRFLHSGPADSGQWFVLCDWNVTNTCPIDTTVSGQHSIMLQARTSEGYVSPQQPTYAYFVEAAGQNPQEEGPLAPPSTGTGAFPEEWGGEGAAAGRIYIKIDQL